MHGAVESHKDVAGASATPSKAKAPKESAQKEKSAEPAVVEPPVAPAIPDSGLHVAAKAGDAAKVQTFHRRALHDLVERCCTPACDLASHPAMLAAAVWKVCGLKDRNKLCVNWWDR